MFYPGAMKCRPTTKSSDLTHKAFLRSLKNSLSDLEAVRIIANSDEGKALNELKETIRARIAALEAD